MNDPSLIKTVYLTPWAKYSVHKRKAEPALAWLPRKKTRELRFFPESDFSPTESKYLLWCEMALKILS